jgi:hypothetical protein
MHDVVHRFGAPDMVRRVLLFEKEVSSNDLVGYKNTEEDEAFILPVYISEVSWGQLLCQVRPGVGKGCIAVSK